MSSFSAAAAMTYFLSWVYSRFISFQVMLGQHRSEVVVVVERRGGIIPRYPRVVPGADACLCVEEVHLALHCCSLLCFFFKETMDVLENMRDSEEHL